MSESSSNLPTHVERFHVPVVVQVPVERPTPLLEVAFTIDCADVDAVARVLHPFVDGDQMILPAHPQLTIGDERALRIGLASGLTVLRGACGAIEYVCSERQPGRPEYVRVQLLGLDAAGTDLLERLVFLKRFHGTPGASREPGALLYLSRTVRASAVTPAPVESTAVLDSADLQPVSISPARRLPPPLPPSPAAVARRNSVLARMTTGHGTPVPAAIGLESSIHRTPTPRSARAVGRTPVLVAVVASLVGLLLLWR
jgi:hypothetical protein